MTKKEKPLLRVWDVVAVLLVILGFGILHNKSRVLEIAGSVCIGIGTLYFLVLLIRSNKKAGDSE
ncbi:hypothetical protein [Mangrovibacterium diazotrophicum]|uniref:Uncharacterized protein n=1 Tax=Mangrovibacterium diazotrophicum TaxID=1261403 RepID=A0A419W2Y2_9BACT|nr:hypothetical protein [Mangrovibacterium diazotrophicum]RKD89847.1 hypothetical protein BC643_0180 [Mangrovibacterium diazotrophicum]